MSINIVKGQEIDLINNNSKLKQMVIGIGWSLAKKDNVDCLRNTTRIDLDSTVFILRNNKIKNNRDIIYFGNLFSRNNEVVHNENNVSDNEDKEEIIVYLDRFNKEINELIIGLSIYSCKTRKQDFNMVEDIFIKVFDGYNHEEILKFNILEMDKKKTAIILGKIYRKNSNWIFKAIGEGTLDNSIDEMACQFRE